MTFLVIHDLNPIKKVLIPKAQTKSEKIARRLRNILLIVYLIISGIEIRSLTGCCTQKPG